VKTESAVAPATFRERILRRFPMLLSPMLDYRPCLCRPSKMNFKQLVRPTFPKLIAPEVTPGRSTSGSMPSATLHSTVPLGLVLPCTQLSQSKSTAHSIPSQSTSKRSKKSKIRHSCTLCNQSFTRAHDLKRHNTIHERCQSAVSASLVASAY
jgi:hypothetical protein